MRRTAATFVAATLSLLLGLPAPADTQGRPTPRSGAGRPLPVPASHPRVREALAHAQRTEPQTVEEQVAICQIPAPPFKEQRRAEDFRRRLEALGLRNVRIDAEGNVIGERPGTPGGPVVVISGHLDTVFPEGTDVTVRREGTVLRGPGIGDDCRGLAVLLATARALDAAGVRTRGTILFVGTVGEEGEGNLRGVRYLFGKELKDRVDYFISVDGTGLGVTNDAVGSHRYRVTYRGPGGHSYGDFGMPNPMHALGRAIARIADFQVPADPKVTFSVGVVEGGTSVNSIAGSARMLVDMRSVDPEALGRLDAEFQRAVRDALAAENARWQSQVKLTVEVDTIGIRPAGRQPAGAPVVRAAVEAGKALGFEARTTASSTDANLPISLGIPAVTIDGGGNGGGAHSLEEWFDTRDSHLGTQWALLYLVTLAGVR
ncbi:MAG TPA: M20/M25/M40 family metallo-hydrolase [Longimicrobiaceae bacterium]|nr:M20/M25/M40 family metallo-hydrolase [Longimicrobiaceae bacterium]